MSSTVLDRVVFVQRILFFVPHRPGRLVQLATTTSTFRDTISNYCEAIFDCWRRHSGQAHIDTAFRALCKRGTPPAPLALSFIAALVAAGAKVDGREGGEGTNTPLHFALTSLCRDVVVLLLRLGARVDLVGNDKSTALHYAASLGVCVEEVLAAGGAATINAKDLYGMTALHIATYWGDAKAVKQLLGAGASQDARDNSGLTAKDHAMVKQHGAVLKVLCDPGSVDEALHLPF